MLKLIVLHCAAILGCVAAYELEAKQPLLRTLMKAGHQLNAVVAREIAVGHEFVDASLMENARANRLNGGRDYMRDTYSRVLAADRACLDSGNLVRIVNQALLVIEHHEALAAHNGVMMDVCAKGGIAFDAMCAGRDRRMKVAGKQLEAVVGQTVGRMHNVLDNIQSCLVSAYDQILRDIDAQRS